MRSRRWKWLLLAGYMTLVGGVFSIAVFAPPQWFSRDVPRSLIVFFGIYCVIMPIAWYAQTGYSSVSGRQDAATDGRGDGDGDDELPKTPLGWIAAIVAAIVLIAQITIYVFEWCVRLLG